MISVHNDRGKTHAFSAIKTPKTEQNAINSHAKTERNQYQSGTKRVLTVSNQVTVHLIGNY